MQPLEVVAGEAQLPGGYTIENLMPPLDNYGRSLLFEALGVDVTRDGTMVVASRTAGIWRIVNGEWRQFAEGLFDSLGVLSEDDAGLVVVAGHKSGLSRISDTNGDGVADRYEVLTDAFSYHGNYHSYLHGPVRDPATGDYFITLNLAHNNDDGYHNAGGQYMGTAGGFRGWAARVPAGGGFEPWADGLRSPAGLGFAPDGRLWYADNQGEYVGTSKIFLLREGGFYGHPGGLIDRPGMTPDSPGIEWGAVKHTRERAVILQPQNKLANSPGNMTWDTTGGRFGPYAGQMFIGDQTQSALMRVATEVVGGVEHSGFLRYLGQFIVPFVQADLLTATLVLLWVAAFLSAAIDNIPFTAAMIPIILGMEAQGIQVAPLWWALAAGVGMGGNGTHIGSTANVYIVTISERLAKRENDPSLAITPWVWFRYGTPAMLATLVMCSLIFYFFFDFYDQSFSVDQQLP